MSPHTHITRKIGRVRAYISELETFRGTKAESLKLDLHKRAALERFLYLACDSIISLMEMIVVAGSYERAESYAENVDILLEHGHIDTVQADLLHKVVGLRNVLSHDYEKMDLGILTGIVNEKLGELKALMDFFEGNYN